MLAFRHIKAPAMWEFYQDQTVLLLFIDWLKNIVEMENSVGLCWAWIDQREKIIEIGGESLVKCTCVMERETKTTERKSLRCWSQ